MYLTSKVLEVLSNANAEAEPPPDKNDHEQALKGGPPDSQCKIAHTIYFVLIPLSSNRQIGVSGFFDHKCYK